MTSATAPLDLLAAHADGSLSEGMALLVASHLTFCPEARRRVARLEQIGGALLSTADETPVSPRCLDATLARIRKEPVGPEDTTAARPCGTLPAPLRARLGCGADEIRWRFLLPGLSEHRLDGFDGEEVCLLRARPGVRILKHTHTGEEATLVLTGRMRDGTTVYGRGDLALADASDDHHPEIVGPDTCICLVVLSGPMRFTGSVGRALNLFTG